MYDFNTHNYSPFPIYMPFYKKTLFHILFTYIPTPMSYINKYDTQFVKLKSFKQQKCLYIHDINTIWVLNVNRNLRTRFQVLDIKNNIIIDHCYEHFVFKANVHLSY